MSVGRLSKVPLVVSVFASGTVFKVKETFLDDL